MQDSNPGVRTWVQQHSFPTKSHGQWTFFPRGISVGKQADYRETTPKNKGLMVKLTLCLPNKRKCLSVELQAGLQEGRGCGGVVWAGDDATCCLAPVYWIIPGAQVTAERTGTLLLVTWLRSLVVEDSQANSIWPWPTLPGVRSHLLPQRGCQAAFQDGFLFLLIDK